MRLLHSAYSRVEVGERACSRQDKVVRLVWLDRPSMWGMELRSRIRVWRFGSRVTETLWRSLLARLTVSRVETHLEEGSNAEFSLSPGKVSWRPVVVESGSSGLTGIEMLDSWQLI